MDTSKAIMVIPTYWAREKPKSGDLIFDHPTPLNENGTLERLLDSLKILEDKIDILIISVPTFNDYNNIVKNKVDKILEKFKDEYNIYHFSFESINKLYEFYQEEGKEEFKSMLSLKGYSPVRNCCIYIPNILDKDVAILIDDDEIFEDSKFIKKALKYISPDIPGIAGYYVQEHGGYKFIKKTPWYRRFWDNIKAMNEAFNIIESENDLVETTFVFGGNMIIHRKLFMNIPFDPFIRRGEDISYLCDAKINGFKFMLNTKLSIKHLPPKSKSPEYIKIREDIYRFVYMRYKLLQQKYNINETLPYPGYFLKEDLYSKIIITSLLYSIDSFSKFKYKDGIQFLNNIDHMIIAYYNSPKWYKKFLKFKEQWPQFMEWSYNNRDKIVKLIFENS